MNFSEEIFVFLKHQYVGNQPSETKFRKKFQEFCKINYVKFKKSITFNGEHPFVLFS